MAVGTLGPVARVAISDPSFVGQARRVVEALAARAGLDETQRGRVALVVTELAGNLSRHAIAGEILAHPYEGAVEIVALDRGPGIDDVGRALRDGYSTAGSPGTGLGAVFRLADRFDMHSTPGAGTVIAAAVGRRADAVGPLTVGAASVPRPHEEVCGDGYAFRPRPDGAQLIVIDGLGHGSGAAAASSAAVEAFNASASVAPAQILEAVHGALGGTRGAAVAVADIDLSRNVVRWASIGNVAGAILLPDGTRRNLVGHGGIVGHEIRRVHEFTYPWAADALFLVHTDGLSGHWRLDRYPGLFQRHPSVVAATLYRDYRRPTDDVTIIVAKTAEAR